jgi:osmotically inducible lipoprotein OsmB
MQISPDAQRRREWDMPRKIIIGVLMGGILLGLAACGEDPATRGVTGGLLGAGAGAGIAAVTGGRPATGAAIGAGAGALGGVLTAR